MNSKLYTIVTLLVISFICVRSSKTGENELVFVKENDQDDSFYNKVDKIESKHH